MSTKYWRAIGLMSGTSLDGLDICYCHLSKNDNQWGYKILQTETIAYPQNWTSSLKNCMQFSGLELMQLDADLGVYFGQCVHSFLKKYGIADVDFIASHGHTVFHQPEKGFTTQIGSGAHIAHTTGIQVINDFRTMDVAKGGNGAPLVPIGDKLLFAEYDACLNLGGIANISFETEHGRMAFDISPFNLVLNALANEKGLPYDDAGKLAKSGQVNQTLLEQLNNLPYYSTNGPKSLGKEWIDHTFFPIVELTKIPTEDKLATCSLHFAQQLQYALPHNTNNILITGGGAHNTFFTETISTLLKAKITIPSAEIIEFKEALTFAFLGALRLNNQTNALASVTGASSDSCTGVIYTP